MFNLPSIKLAFIPNNIENITGLLVYDDTTAYFPYPEDIFKINIIKLGNPLSFGISALNNIYFPTLLINQEEYIRYTVGLPLYYIHFNSSCKFNNLIEKLIQTKDYKKRAISFKLLRSMTGKKGNVEIEEIEFLIYHIGKETYLSDNLGEYSYLLVGMDKYLYNIYTQNPNKINNKNENIKLSDIFKLFISEQITIYNDKNTNNYSLVIPKEYNHLYYLQTILEDMSNYFFFYDEVKKRFVLDKIPIKFQNYGSYGFIFKNIENPVYLNKLNQMEQQIVKKDLFKVPHIYNTIAEKNGIVINQISFISPYRFSIGEIIYEAFNTIPETTPHLVVSAITSYTQFLSEKDNKLYPITYSNILTIT